MSSELIEFEQEKAVELFQVESGLEGEIAKVKNLVDSFEHDMSTAKGRAATKSFAAKIPTLKNKWDKYAVDLTEEWKNKKAAVDKNRRYMKEEMDKLKVEARKPLTKWEEEQERIEAEKKALAEAEKLRILIENDHEIGILLNREYDRIAQEKAKEAERLRLEKEAKEESDRLDREKEIADNARKQAEAAAKEAELKAKAKAERKEREAKEAIEKAERERQQAIEDAKNAKIEAEKAARLERERIEAQQAEEKAKADKLAANQAHRRKINSQVLDSLTGFGLDKQTAKKLIEAIAKGEIANTSINYGG